MKEIKPLEFGITYDVTDLAKSLDREYTFFEKIFIFVDDFVFWINRIKSGVNSDYEEKEGAFILEYEKIRKKQLSCTINTLAELKEILKNATFDNDMLQDMPDLKSCIKEVNGGDDIKNLEYYEVNNGK